MQKRFLIFPHRDFHLKMQKPVFHAVIHPWKTGYLRFCIRTGQILEKAVLLGPFGLLVPLVFQHHARQLLTVHELPHSVRKQTVQQDERSRRDRRRNNAAEQQIRQIPVNTYIQHEQPAPVCLQDGFQVE